MKRKMYMGMLVLGLFFLVSISFVAYARANTITKTYGGIDLTCYINCTNTYGEGSTYGANFDGYKNYVKVATYNVDQIILDAKETINSVKAYVKVTKGSPYLTRTFHAAVSNIDGTQLLPAYQQIKQTQGRD